jgi:hypothetical protein
MKELSEHDGVGYEFCLTRCCSATTGKRHERTPAEVEPYNGQSAKLSSSVGHTIMTPVLISSSMPRGIEQWVELTLTDFSIQSELTRRRNCILASLLRLHLVLSLHTLS